MGVGRMAYRVPVRNKAGQTIGWVIWDEFGDLVDVNGLHVPAEIHLRFPGAPEQPSLHATFGIRNGEPVCTAVSVEAKPHGDEVRPGDFDIVRRELANWSQAVITSVMQHNATGAGDTVNVPDFADAATAQKAYRESRRRVRRKVDEQLLTEVAALYRDNIDDKPWKAIVDRFNVSETTAARYVVQARKAGLLPPTEPGRKKA
jgi:hypothetical protein